jgi:ArsR family transcriptional regulator
MPTTTAESTAADTAALFHALADPMRIEVLELLANGERCVCDLMEDLGVAQSRLSWHLKTLKQAGLVTDRREGRWSYYTLERVAFDRAEKALSALKPRTRRLAVRAADACCD